MSLNAIALFRSSGGPEFYFDGCGPFSPSAVGKAIVNALLQGSELAEIGWRESETVTVNYLVQMLRHSGRKGEFYDGLEGGDHDFDRNTPTPGDCWAEVQDLRARYRAALADARHMAGSEVLADLAPALALVARDFSEEAELVERGALGYGIDDERAPKPLRDALTVPSARLWNRRIGADAIWWDGQVFKFGGYFVSPTLLGRMIAITLLRGEEWVRVGDIDVTVSYLVQMCREVGKHGEFTDLTDDEFDPNVAPDMSPDEE